MPAVPAGPRQAGGTPNVYEKAFPKGLREGLNLLDIVIVNYNSTDYLLRCLRSIFDAARSIPLEVLVQDNDSRDNVDRVRKFHEGKMGGDKSVEVWGTGAPRRVSF